MRLLALVLLTVLPSGWIIPPPPGLMTYTDTMPQGAAASPDGTRLAVVESGFNPATLRIYRTSDLEQTASIPLAGAMDRPLWLDDATIVLAGANADALLRVDLRTQRVQTIAMPPKSQPIAIARHGTTFAVATDGDGALRIGALDALAAAPAIAIGQHPGAVAFSGDGATVFCANRAGSSVAAVDVRTRRVAWIRTGLHPSALLVRGNDLYVAASDDDRVDVFRTDTFAHVAAIDVGERVTQRHLPGASPNALASAGDAVFVSLGAENAVAVLHRFALRERIAVGRYPTDVVPVGKRLFVVNGKGEGTQANPHFDAISKSFYDYVGAIEYGSIRVYPIDGTAQPRAALGAYGWQNHPDSNVIRPNGPIKHVFFVLKENRSYDQILGDLSNANGDAQLAIFGERITPNQHALARAYGIFDNTYTNGEVSDAGHNWADAAFANDYVERFWPPIYGGRRDDDDVLAGQGAGVPRDGYMWDEARRDHVSFRDYGEMIDSASASLKPFVDKRYVGWNLDYSDVDRVKEWRREFRSFVRRGTVPQLEYIWLPNDHTHGTSAGSLTPQAYVAQNDYAVGLLVAEISHSPIWSSSAIFIIEDDAQDGADHVSDQRTTLYVASPYAKGGVQHGHYTTVGVLRTIEIVLGMHALSAYDGMAVPLTAAFTSRPSQAPFTAIDPRIDLHARNGTHAYGARISATLDFSRPDAATPTTLRHLIECSAHEIARSRPSCFAR